MGETFILNEKESKWEYQDDFPGLRYKLLVDSTKIDSDGISMGIVELEPGGELPLHHHSPQEIYIIKKGTGLLLGDSDNREVLPGETIYIPKNTKHGLRNLGTENLAIYWIFPTDCWEEVKYLYD